MTLYIYSEPYVGYVIPKLPEIKGDWVRSSPLSNVFHASTKQPHKLMCGASLSSSGLHVATLRALKLTEPTTRAARYTICPLCLDLAATEELREALS